jgi:hypothetical protein
MTVVVHNKFENPATGETYTWARNHAPDGEDDAGKARPVERIPNTAGGTAAFQQGEDGLYTIKWKGTLTRRDQWRALWYWYGICKNQTIYLTDFDGQKYEGTISSFTGKRVGRSAVGIAQDATMKLFKFEYNFEFTVVNFLAGDLHDMGVTG